MADEAWNQRRMAARKYQPQRVRLLLVAESPASEPAQYFYAEGDADALFANVCEVLFEQAPAGDKTPYLKELRRRGVFAVELKPDAPRANEPLGSYVAPFLLNLETWAPEKIILISSDVYDAAYAAMKKAKLPVLDVKIPAPSGGREVEFRQKLRQALVRAELEKLIRPLPASRRP